MNRTTPTQSICIMYKKHNNVKFLSFCLIKNIHGSFQTCASPESFLERAPSMLSTEPSGRKVVLIAASNLKNSARHFSSKGFDIQDLTVPGWVASQENIEILQSKLMSSQADSNTVFIFDLLGNSAYRFEQFDGTQSLPFKSNNKYHLAGNVVTCAPTTLKKLVEGIVPIIAAKREAVGLIIPPLPRYPLAAVTRKSTVVTSLIRINLARCFQI
jgi:hypothetical protein